MFTSPDCVVKLKFLIMLSCSIPLALSKESISTSQILDLCQMPMFSGYADLIGPLFSVGMVDGIINSKHVLLPVHFVLVSLPYVLAASEVPSRDLDLVPPVAHCRTHLAER